MGRFRVRVTSVYGQARSVYDGAGTLTAKKFLFLGQINFGTYVLIDDTAPTGVFQGPVAVYQQYSTPAGTGSMIIAFGGGADLAAAATDAANRCALQSLWPTALHSGNHSWGNVGLSRADAGVAVSSTTGVVLGSGLPASLPAMIRHLGAANLNSVLRSTDVIVGSDGTNSASAKALALFPAPTGLNAAYWTHAVVDACVEIT
jgi:hypothetical protein